MGESIDTIKATTVELQAAQECTNNNIGGLLFEIDGKMIDMESTMSDLKATSLQTQDALEDYINDSGNGVSRIVTTTNNQHSRASSSANANEKTKEERKEGDGCSRVFTPALELAKIRYEYIHNTWCKSTHITCYRISRSSIGGAIRQRY